jgi:hypothetical protein
MKKNLLILTLMLVIGTGVMLSQTKVGTAVGTFLLIEPSARLGAMGNAGVTVDDEIQGAFFNPAAIGRMSGSGAQFTHSPWFAGISYDYVGVVGNLGNFGNLYGSVTSLNSGEIDVRTVEAPGGTGERYKATDIAFGLGYGRQISDRFSVGVQLTYLQETIWHSSLSGFAINMGTLYEISPNGLRIGASISNVGTRPKFDGRDLRVQYDQSASLYGDNPNLPAELFTNDFPLPIMFRVGLGLPVTISDDYKLEFVADALHPSDNTESVNVGGEWLFFNTFAIRGGYQHLFEKDSEVGLTLGAGVQYQSDSFRVFFDYGWASHKRLDQIQRMTVGIMF